MSAYWRDSLLGWLVDYYVLSSVLLLAGLVMMRWLKQPARLLECGMNDPPARLRLRLCAAIGQPVALGLFRPAIVLPEAFAAKEPTVRIRMALAHEWAHICNGDLVLLAGWRLLLPILYLHPLYWWLRQSRPTRPGNIGRCLDLGVGRSHHLCRESARLVSVDDAGTTVGLVYDAGPVGTAFAALQASRGLARSRLECRARLPSALENDRVGNGVHDRSFDVVGDVAPGREPGRDASRR